MTAPVYVVDTSSIIELFHITPIDRYRSFWDEFTQKFRELVDTGRMIVLDVVYNEVNHDAIGSTADSDDPIVKWMKQWEHNIISLGISHYQRVVEILEKFPTSANIDKVPPAADPFLIAYVLEEWEQERLDGVLPDYVIVTQEKRNPNQRKKMEQLRKKSGIIPEITKLPSICDYYRIETLDYLGLFRTENWVF